MPKYFFFTLLSLLDFNSAAQDSIKTKHEISFNEFSTWSSDSLFSYLKTSSNTQLDTSNFAFIALIKKGITEIPNYIQKITDSTITTIQHDCKDSTLTIGDIAYLVCDEISRIGVMKVIKIQFCLIEVNENGKTCWSFYDYLFTNESKLEIQKRLLNYFDLENFKYRKYPKKFKNNYSSFGIMGCWVEK